MPEQAAAGAFFDALVGQQDRNDGNILWYEERRRIFLIDHGFAFARPDANSGEVILTNWRARQGDRRLTDTEVGALQQLVDADLDGLAEFVEESRAEALRGRAARMLDSRNLPLVGSF